MARPYRSELLGEWVLLAGDDEFVQVRPPVLSHQLSLLGEVLEPVARTAAEAWVIYRDRELRVLRTLSDVEKLVVHRVKRVFGGEVEKCSKSC